jgi:hypothetical protein
MGTPGCSARTTIRSLVSGHRNRICIWTEFDIKQYAELGELPSCFNHEHITRDKASKLVANVLFTKPDPRNKRFRITVAEAYWIRMPGIPKYSAVTFENPRTWVSKNSAGFTVKQYVAG